MSLPFRSRVEHKTYPVIERLNRLPRIIPFLVIVALIGVGIFVPNVGFIATLLVVALVAFLIYYTWPRLTGPEKMLRLAVLLLAVALVMIQAFPRQ